MAKDRYTIPRRIHDALEVLEKTGQAKIEGVSFDLSPDIFHTQGWVQGYSIANTPPTKPGRYLYFPWFDSQKAKALPDYICVRPGDTIIIRDIVTEAFGTALDDERDRQIKTAYLAVRRGGELIEAEDRIRFYRAGTFAGLPLTSPISYEAAVERLRGHLEPDFFDLRITSDKISLELYEAAIRRSQEPGVSAQWKSALHAHGGFVMTEFFKSAHHDVMTAFGPVVGAVSTMPALIDRMLNGATALGYWLAKCEAAPHVPDALAGKKRKASSKAAGRKTANIQKDRADKKWRAEGLRLAKSMRTKHANYGQKALAKLLLEELDAKKLKPPDLDTIIRQIRAWEKNETLPRSTRYKRGSK